MRRQLSSERAVLDGRILRVVFRSGVPCFACDLRDAAGATARTVPVLPSGAGYACVLDLAGLPAGTYTIAVRSGDISLPFGASLAGAQKKTGRAAGRATARRKIAASALPPRGRASFAALYVDPAVPELRLRLSAADDIDAFLAAPREASGPHFSVVSAVHNVEKYLDAYFAALTEQTLDFRTHIEIIAIDDGSTDGSAAIIKRWQRKHPGNIRYLRKENGGPASARTLGLAEAKGEWLTFIDPDDFISPNYFADVSAAIAHHGGRAGLVSCNIVFHMDADGAESDTHPLRFRFAAGEKALPAGALGRFLQLNTATAFFRRDIIEKAGLTFDERIRPGFEDAHFAGRYLIAAGDRLAIFLPTARYSYRKRIDSSSLVDGFEKHPEWYGDHLGYGLLGLINATRDRDGRVPKQVQDTVLYTLVWKFMHVADRPETLAFLSAERRDAFLALLAEVFAAIDVATIVDYDITDLPLFMRVGILNLFKETDPPSAIAEVTGFDAAQSEARVVCWSRSRDAAVRYRVGGRPVEARFRKLRRHDFAGEDFVWEHIAWVPAGGADILGVTVDGQEATLAVRQRRFRGATPVADLRAALALPVRPEDSMPEEVRILRRLARSPKAVADFRDAWLFIDRDREADDSAEHLYRHVRATRPDINAYFILARDAPHWQRLAADGFRLIAFNEPEHALALMNATHLISSQADHYVTGYLGRRFFGDLLRYRFTYLRHGVSKDDTSAWLNDQAIDCLVASTAAEYDAIVGDGSPYKFTEKEVVLAGLPRHDVLLRGNSPERRFVVVMPTWRSALTGPALGPGNARSVDPAFFASDFALRWSAFLAAPRLAALAAQGYEVVFVPHPNMEHYLGRLAPPKFVSVRRFADGTPIHEIFQKCAVFVTDYSSKSFDLALLGKQVVYYQFDRDTFFGGGHMGRAGYFDYERDGFGPVARDESAAFDAIDAALASGVAPDYARRAAAAFAFRDGRNSERVLAAVLALDERKRIAAVETA